MPSLISLWGFHTSQDKPVIDWRSKLGENRCLLFGPYMLKVSKILFFVMRITPGPGIISAVIFAVLMTFLIVYAMYYDPGKEYSNSFFDDVAKTMQW